MMERFALLAWLIACAAQAAEPNAVYDRRETWAESMTATRRNVAQLQAQNLKLPDDGTNWAAVWEESVPAVLDRLAGNRLAAARQSVAHCR